MRRGVLACAVVWLGVAPATAEPDAAAREDSAGCRIRTVAVDEEGIATVEAHCRWDVTPAWLVSILRDPAQLDAALSTLSECRAVPGGRVEVHTVGWPIADRQVTLDWSEHSLSGGGARFHFARSARQEPLRAGRVAVSLEEGFWEVRPAAGGGARLEYSTRYDAGGNLRPSVTRGFQRSGIAHALAELRAAAERLEAGARDVAAAPPH